MERLNACPQPGFETTYNYAVSEAKFGDGYIQEVGLGINNERRSLKVEFKGNQTEMTTLRNFLRNHSGYKPFQFRPPKQDDGYFVARNVTVTDLGANILSVEADLEERF